MTVSTDYKVYLVHHDPGAILEDVSARCGGFTVEQQCEVGSLGWGKASATLHNFDGALTPGNGGTYSNLDLFNCGLVIHASVTGNETSTAYIFEGIITDVTFNDDGVTSTVEITARDALSVGARAPVDVDLALPSSVVIFLSMEDAADAMYRGYSTYIDPLPMPDLGYQYGAEANFLELSPAESWVPQILDDLTNVTPYDVVSNIILPSAPGVAYPTTITWRTTPNPSNLVVYNARIIERDLTKPTGTASTDRRDFIFDETPSVGALPFRNLNRAFNTPDLTNSAQITRSATGATEQTAQDTDSVNKYGARNRAYTTTNVNDADALTAATIWANRFSTSRFTPTEIDISDRMVEALDDADDDLWEDLIDVRTGIWSTATITYTPTGGSQRTDVCVITGRLFTVTPTEGRLRLFLRPAEDYQSLVFDSSILGVLDTNRLG